MVTTEELLRQTELTAHVCLAIEREYAERLRIAREDRRLAEAKRDEYQSRLSRERALDGKQAHSK
jgi:hypothetical protein